MTPRATRLLSGFSLILGLVIGYIGNFAAGKACTCPVGDFCPFETGCNVPALTLGYIIEWVGVAIVLGAAVVLIASFLTGTPPKSERPPDRQRDGTEPFRPPKEAANESPVEGAEPEGLQKP